MMTKGINKMAQKVNQKSGLIYPENYKMYAPIAYGEHMTIFTKDINIKNWNDHYTGLLNIFKDGIYSDEVHHTMVTVVFNDGVTLELSIFDYFINIIMWYMLVASNTPIVAHHVFFANEITQNTIKNFTDTYLIDENRKKISNVILNNIIDDALNKLHDIDLFSMYLSNTLCLEDSIALMKANPEFRECLNLDISGVPLEDVKSVGMKAANRSIEIIKDSKKYLGYDHCLADAFRAQQGINSKQYKEFQINIGTKPDGRGGVWPTAINKSFINGGVTDPMDYFIESSTGRTAQIIKLKNVGTSGTFARNLGLNNMDSKLYDDPNYDCRSNNFIKFEIKSKKALEMLHNRYYRLNPKGMDHLLNSRKDIHLLGKTIYLRSPATCASAANGKGVCYKCYGDLAYTLFDVEQGFGINIGRIASEILSSALTQKLLSAKHLLETAITKVTWCDEFNDFFEIVDNIIKIAPELDYKDYKLQINPDAIEMENDEDSDLSDDEDSGYGYNEYITSFDVVKVSTGEVFHITNDKMEQLFITSELNAAIHKKQDPVDGMISISFNELKESYLFVMQIENNELTKTLNKLLSILNKKPVTQSYPSVSDLYQDLVDTTIEGGLDIAATHLEIILMNQLRDPDDIFEKPHWWEHNPPYNIITLNEALTNNPSVVISLSYQKIKKMFYNPLTFKKKGASFMDLFFMERPQRTIYDIPEDQEEKRKPGELVDPFIPIDDPNKITVAESEELDQE